MKKLILTLLLISIFGLVQNVVFAQDQDINFVAYVSRLENKVKSNWAVPSGKIDKKTVILLDIDKSGKLLSANIINFSGDKEFDKTSMDAVIQSTPFESFPQTINDANATIKVIFDQTEFEAVAVSDVKVSDNNNANNAETNIYPVAEKKSVRIAKNNPPIMIPYPIRPYQYYHYRPYYYYESHRSNFYNNYRPYCNPYNSYYCPSRVVNNYYTEVPADFSSPVTKFWAADRLIWLSFLIAHVCKHGI